MPTTTGFATDLITFSRGSLATVTDSDGYINWAQHNLLLASEQLDTSSWTKSSATVTANSIAAPDGTTTADTIAASGANGTTLQSYSAIAVSYVFGVWLRRKTGAGNIQIAADNGTYTTVTITNDWALYTVTQTPTAGTKSAGIRIVTSGDEVYAWGAHLYRSDLGGMQANASAYPYYNPSTPKNLLGFTEAFDNAAWTKGNSSISANTIAAPNGSLSADTLVSAASTTATFTNQAFTSTAAAYTFSVYVKASGARFVQLLWTGGISTNFANFDLTLATVTSGNYTSASITDAANGWYRLAITSTLSGAAGNTNINLVDSGAATRGSSFTGDGISGVYLWGAQLSSSASLDSYTPNFGAAPSAAAAHGPRLDYDPSTLAAKGLLVEEQRTNLLTYSEQFNDAVYVKVATTVTANATTAPDGTATADKIISDATNVQHSIGPSVTFASNTTYSLSVFAKAAERSSFAFGPRGNGKPITTTFNLSTLSFSGDVSTGGTIVSKSYQLLPNGWIRVVLVFTTDNSGTVPSNVNFSDTNFAVVAGNGVDGIFLWGAQLEAGPFATSYIPTAAASVTRNADVAFVATSQFPYSATEGTLVANVSLIAIKSTVQMYAELGDGTFNNRMGIYSASTTAEAIIDTVGSRQATLSIGSVTSGSAIKSALAYKLNDIAACLNGGSVSSDTSALIPIVNVLAIGSQTARFADINGHIRQITYIPRRLTNAELQARTA
jgi:hypothetical protein